MPRTQKDRDEDLALGRELERKDAEIERLTADNKQFQEANHFYRDGVAALEKENERLRAAIRITAGQGTYDELAIRKAVGFELAEMIVNVRNTYQQQASDAK